MDILVVYVYLNVESWPGALASLKLAIVDNIDLATPHSLPWPVESYLNMVYAQVITV